MESTIRVLLQACLLSAFIVVGAVNAVGSEHAPQPLVQVDGQRLSVRADQVPAETILAEIARQGGIEITIQGSLSETVTIEMVKVPIEAGLKRLIAGRNHAMTYQYDSNQAVVIKQLHIYAGEKGGDIRPPLPGNTPRPSQSVRAKTGEGIVVHAPTPAERNPLVSMQAIDPLMKINGAQAPYLPNGFHHDMANRADRLSSARPHSGTKGSND